MEVRSSVLWAAFLLLDAPPVRDFVVQPNGVGCDLIISVLPNAVMDHTVEGLTWTYCHVILHLYLTREEDGGMVELVLAKFYPFHKPVLLRLCLSCWYSLVYGDPASSTFSIPPAGMDYVDLMIHEGFEQLRSTLYCDFFLNLAHEIDNCYYRHVRDVGCSF